MSDDIQYPDHFIDRLHTVWGEGFLSPGGPAEVAEIVRGLDLSGKTVLDIGFGTGGPAVVLARDCGAGQVIGIDVEAQLKPQAEAFAARQGVGDRVAFRIVDPGPLPFADTGFDVVFSKDSIIHIADKSAMFSEVFRVLKPGGRLAVSDWLTSEDPEERALMEGDSGSHLHFDMSTAREMEAMIRDAGFEDVSHRDRNAWYAEQCRQELKAWDGPLYAELVAKVGAELVETWAAVRRDLAHAAIGGGLRPTHLFGRKPD